MTRNGLVALLLLALAWASAWAQDGEGQDRLLTLDAREREALERLADAPVPAGADRRVLREHFDRKAAAAMRLGSPAVLGAVLRAAMQALPDDSRWPNDLAWVVFDEGRSDEARQLFEAAMARAPRASDRLFYESNRIAVLLGGIAAEEIIYNENSTGASNDHDGCDAGISGDGQSGTGAGAAGSSSTGRGRRG